MSPLKLTIFVVCLTVGVVICLADDSQDQALDEEDFKVKLAEADSLKNKDQQKDEQKDQKDDSDDGDDDKSRKKRQVDYYPKGYARTPYLGYPFGYNPLRPFSRLPDASYTFNDLPMFQFFNSFYNAGVVRSNGLLVRHYLRTGTTYNTAYQDFRNLPLRNVRQVRTDTRVVTTVNNGDYFDYEGDLFGFPDVTVRLQGRGCYLDGYSNLPGLPCIRFFSNSNVFGRVRRNLIYLRGFTDTNPFFVAGK